jgi:acetyl esterase/lipase
MKPGMTILACCAISLTLLAGCRVGDPAEGHSMVEVAPDETEYSALIDTIAYRSTPTRLLDVYPAQGENPSGIAIVFAHGGGWTGGSRTTASEHPVFQFLLEEVHVGFSIDYRLARIPGVTGQPLNCTQTESPFPDNLDDVKWAIGWANKPENKALYNYDRVVVVGESAGGHLAGLAAVTSDQRPAGIPAEYNIRPDAGVTIVAPLDMTTWGSQGEEGVQGFENIMARWALIANKTDWANPLQCLFGSQYTTTSDVPISIREAASASEHVDLGDPPIYMVSATSDALAFTEFNADVLEQAYSELTRNGSSNSRAWNDQVELGHHFSGRTDTNAVVLSFFLGKVVNGDFD